MIGEYKRVGRLPRETRAEPGTYGFIALDYGSSIGLYIADSDGVIRMTKLSLQEATDFAVRLGEDCRALQEDAV